MSITIVVCGNAETWGSTDTDLVDFENRCLDKRCDEFDVEIISDFRHWNGGPGYNRFPAYVRLDGYGPVKSMAEARYALGFMLAGGGSTPETKVSPPDEWPSSAELEAAFDAVDLINDFYVDRGEMSAAIEACIDHAELTDYAEIIDLGPGKFSCQAGPGGCTVTFEQAPNGIWESSEDDLGTKEIDDAEVIAWAEDVIAPTNSRKST